MTTKELIDIVGFKNANEILRYTYCETKVIPFNGRFVNSRVFTLDDVFKAIESRLRTNRTNKEYWRKMKMMLEKKL